MLQYCRVWQTGFVRSPRDVCNDSCLRRLKSGSDLPRIIRNRKKMTNVEMKSRDLLKTSEILTRLWSLFSSLYSSLTFSFINPLLKDGAANELDEYSAITVNPLNETIEDMQTEFDQIYRVLKEAIYLQILA